jgi:predicted phage tail protein
LTTIGTNMIIGGITQMLTPQRQGMNSATSGMDRLDPAALATNYSFTGLSNISQAGVPVNLVFGEIMVGSITVSNGIDTVQVEGDNE